MGLGGGGDSECHHLDGLPPSFLRLLSSLLLVQMEEMGERSGKGLLPFCEDLSLSGTSLSSCWILRTKAKQPDAGLELNNGAVLGVICCANRRNY